MAVLGYILGFIAGCMLLLYSHRLANQDNWDMADIIVVLGFICLIISVFIYIIH